MADLSDNTNWFETDASNNKASPNGWPEGMMPSGVNDTARADKGALKRFWDKLNPVQNITAAGGVYTFVTSNTAYPTAYVAGELYSFKALTTSTGGDQFQVNALGPRAIVKWRNSAWVPIVAGDIEGATAPQLIYDAAINAGVGGFILLNPHLPVVNDGAGGTSLDGSLTVVGSLQVNNNINCATISCGNYGTVNAGAINASGDIHGPNLRADGSLFVGGVQVYNNGGWLYSPSSMQSAGTVQANASGAAALYAPNGGISTGGDLSCRNVNAANDVAAAGVYRLHPVGGGSKGARIEGFSGSAWDYLAIAFDGGSNILFSPNDGASGRAATTVTFSDARLKDNIRDTEVDALAVILATPVRAFEWNEEGRLLTPHRPDPVPCGLVAQELEEAIPLAVGTVSLAGDMRHIIDQHLTPYLMRAIQQLAERVTQVEAR